MGNAVITKKGLALLAKLPQGTALEITGAKTGTGSVDISSLQDQASVTSPKQTLTIQNVSYQEDGKCSLIMSVTNDGVLSSYTIMQVGVFANDPDEGEILFSIYQANSGEGINIPSATILPGYNAEWSYNIKFDKADNVTVNVDPSNTVTRAAMEAYASNTAQAAVKEHAESQSPHAGVLATQTDLTAHTSNKNNPHGVTAEQLNLAAVASSGSYNDLKDQPDFVAKANLPALYVWEKYENDPGQLNEMSQANAKICSDSRDIPYANGVTVINGKVFLDGEQKFLNAETAISSRDASAILGKYIRAASEGNDNIYYIAQDATFTFQTSTIIVNTAKRQLTRPFLGYVCSDNEQAYPGNGAHTDGYWYVYRGQVYEKPYTYGPEDLVEGASPLQDGKLYLVYE